MQQSGDASGVVAEIRGTGAKEPVSSIITDKPVIRFLQMGRALAALAVVLFHASGLFTDPRYGMAAPFGAMTHRGDLGVDFFFVLSGFILMQAHRSDFGKPSSLFRYVSRRIIRIYPVYWIFTLLVILGAAAVDGVTALPVRVSDISSTILLVRITDFPTPLGVAWTLFHEMLFYAFFAVLIVNRRVGFLVLAIWFALVAAQFHYNPFGQWHFMDVFLSAHNLSFLLGIGAFYLSPFLTRLPAIGFLSCGVLLLPLIVQGEFALGRSDLLQFVYSFAFAAIIAGGVALERLGSISVAAWIVLLGDASYVLYLSHENVGGTAIKIAHHLGLLDRVDPHFLFFGIVLVSLAFAMAFHRWIEAPLLQLLKQGVGANRRLFRYNPI